MIGYSKEGSAWLWEQTVLSTVPRLTSVLPTNLYMRKQSEEEKKNREKGRRMGGRGRKTIIMHSCKSRGPREAALASAKHFHLRGYARQR